MHLQDHIGNSQASGGYYATNNNDYLTGVVGGGVDGPDFSNLQGSLSITLMYIFVNLTHISYDEPPSLIISHSFRRREELPLLFVLAKEKGEEWRFENFVRNYFL